MERNCKSMPHSPDSVEFARIQRNSKPLLQVGLIAAHRSSLKGLKRSFVPTTMDILEIVDTNSEYGRTLHTVLESGSSLRRYKTYTIISHDEETFLNITAKYGGMPGATVQKLDVTSEDSSGSTHDLVVISSVSVSSLEVLIDSTQKLLKPKGQILIPTKTSDINSKILEKKGLYLLQQDDTFMLFGTPNVVDDAPSKDLVLVTRRAPSQFELNVLDILSASGRKVTSMSLADTEIKINPDAVYVCTIESESSIFRGSVTEQELKALQIISGSTHNILWVTHGDLLAGGDPEAAIVVGMGRCLQTEQPSLMFRTLDLDHRDPKLTVAQVSIIVDTMDHGNSSNDKEFIVKDGVFYVSRLAQDTVLDEQYEAALNSEPTVAKYHPEAAVRLNIERVGMLDTLHFEESRDELPLDDEFAEVEVKALGLNMKVC
jgi:hypothetical protein